jgi:hypothetical protein
MPSPRGFRLLVLRLLPVKRGTEEESSTALAYYGRDHGQELWHHFGTDLAPG